VVALSTDLRSRARPRRSCARPVKALGGLRGVAITTGLGRRGQRDLLAGSDEDWLATFDDVLLATVRACRAAVPVLIEGGGWLHRDDRRLLHPRPKAHQFPYATLKAGVATLTKNVAKSFGIWACGQLRVPGRDRDGDTRRAGVPTSRESRHWPYDEALERVMTEEWGMQVALGGPDDPRSSATSSPSCSRSGPATSPGRPSTLTAATDF